MAPRRASCLLPALSLFAETCTEEAAMFELPEYATLARQCNDTLKGRIVKEASLGNLSHKFVWYNRKPDEFRRLAKGKRVGKARARGK